MLLSTYCFNFLMLMFVCLFFCKVVKNCFKALYIHLICAFGSEYILACDKVASTQFILLRFYCLFLTIETLFKKILDFTYGLTRFNMEKSSLRDLLTSRT